MTPTDRDREQAAAMWTDMLTMSCDQIERTIAAALATARAEGERKHELARVVLATLKCHAVSTSVDIIQEASAVLERYRKSVAAAPPSEPSPEPRTTSSSAAWGTRYDNKGVHLVAEPDGPNPRDVPMGAPATTPPAAWVPRVVCTHCNDTHRMYIGDEGESREVMCTHCPTPCQRCRQGGNGPYCGKTPCDCDCHPLRPAPPEARPGETCEHLRVAAEVADQTLRVFCMDCDMQLAVCWAGKHVPEDLWNRACENDPENFVPLPHSRPDFCAICHRGFTPPSPASMSTEPAQPSENRPVPLEECPTCGREQDPAQTCGACGHDRVSHRPGELCDAMADAPVADCDCVGFVERDVKPDNMPEPDAARRERLGLEVFRVYCEGAVADEAEVRALWEGKEEWERDEASAVGTRLYDLGWREAEEAARRDMGDYIDALRGIQDALGIKKYGALVGPFPELIAAAARLREVERQHNLLWNRLESWTHEMGAGLCPTGGWSDSFGDGMRAAKDQVSRMLRAAPAPAVGKETR